MINKIIETCSRIKGIHTPIRTILKIQEEVGELATEVSIQEGLLPYKTPGIDGVIGEACDVIISTVDLIYLNNPEVKESDILEIINNKLKKWEDIK